ncbi:MAG: 2,3-bisphosphoglycerate-independent phosphoglycerate mutase [Patescibacteria group bacterium]|nr:2,3-bisphosphoglycerate-independent phosphoglycerate mutase [Patescibacteria group bacterium]MDD4611019.1 2,3-bisphosphoglycerate-independent phosphoglycerate mutase [Patescibacteria group bacterium]
MDKDLNILPPKPLLLIILDGWGVKQNYSGNAITQAETPFFNKLIANYPAATLKAAGSAVGLPDSQPGNSEVGHMNIGLGRIVTEDLLRINKSIKDKSFFRNPVLKSAIKNVKENNSNLHLLGLISDANKHASTEHLFALLKLAKTNKIKEVYLHLFLDGLDINNQRGLELINKIKDELEKIGIGIIATVSGRFYAMDRDNHWERTAMVYEAIVNGEGKKVENINDAISQCYQNKIYDEEISSLVAAKYGESITKVGDNDSVIFFNFRPDRARQLTKAFLFPDKVKSSKIFKNLFFISFTEYEKDLAVSVAFPPEYFKNSISEVIANAGLKQLHIAETEKYAHVTYFFNGGEDKKFAGEDDILVPSPIVSSYDLKPEMSALKITEELLKQIEKNYYDFIAVNYANPDMVAHAGDVKAVIKAIECLDKCLEKLVNLVLIKNGTIIITSDHGNAESMLNMQTEVYEKGHSNSPVPFIIVSKEFEGKNIGFEEAPGHDLSLLEPEGALADISPTILKILNLEQPKEMTGESLI